MPININIIADTAQEAINLMRALIMASQAAPAPDQPAYDALGLTAPMASDVTNHASEPEPAPPAVAPRTRGPRASKVVPPLDDDAAGDVLADAAPAPATAATAKTSAKTNGKTNGAAAAAPARDDAVDMAMALDLLREVYERPGEAPAGVMAVLPEFNVSKFSDIPLSQAFDLLTRARALDLAHVAL